MILRILRNVLIVAVETTVIMALVATWGFPESSRTTASVSVWKQGTSESSPVCISRAVVLHRHSPHRYSSCE